MAESRRALPQSIARPVVEFSVGLYPLDLLLCPPRRDARTGHSSVPESSRRDGNSLCVKERHCRMPSMRCC